MRKLHVLLLALCSLGHPSHSLCHYIYPLTKDVSVPTITVFRQMEDTELVMVWCAFGRRFAQSSFQLSVDCEQNYTLKDPQCIANEVCVFNITVRPPFSLTCIHEIVAFENYSYLRSETYVLNHHEGVSSFYIGFFSFTVVGVIIMTAAVIMTTIRSNAKDSNKDYVDVQI